jgi:hypothetical protein
MRKKSEVLMKPIALKISILTVLFSLAAAMPARAARLVLAGGSGLWLQGDSTLHLYHSTATELRASGRMDVAKPFPQGAIEGFELVVPVKGLKSGKGGLDKNMYAALKADEFPDISFSLVRLAAEPGENGGFSMKAEGVLSVAGQRRDIVLEAVGTGRNGRFEIEGKEPLLMTDFGVKPPVMMLGAVKTRNEVTIHYRIILNVEEETQEARP